MLNDVSDKHEVKQCYYGARRLHGECEIIQIDGVLVTGTGRQAYEEI